MLNARLQESIFLLINNGYLLCSLLQALGWRDKVRTASLLHATSVLNARLQESAIAAGVLGTQFTCFTGTRVQILTEQALLDNTRLQESAIAAGVHTHTDTAAATLPTPHTPSLRYLAALRLRLQCWSLRAGPPPELSEIVAAACAIAKRWSSAPHPTSAEDCQVG